MGAIQAGIWSQASTGMREAPESPSEAALGSSRISRIMQMGHVEGGADVQTSNVSVRH